MLHLLDILELGERIHDHGDLAKPFARQWVDVGDAHEHWHKMGVSHLYQALHHSNCSLVFFRKKGQHLETKVADLNKVLIAQWAGHSCRHQIEVDNWLIEELWKFVADPRKLFGHILSQLDDSKKFFLHCFLAYLREEEVRMLHVSVELQNDLEKLQKLINDAATFCSRPEEAGICHCFGGDVFR